LNNKLKYEYGKRNYKKVFRLYNPFDYVEFKNGYSKDAPRLLVECKGIMIGNAKPEWSDNWKGGCFIISLGKIVMSKV
jgi:hypothetical protein